MEIYNKLPYDIKEIILNKYLIFPQNKDLLNDIKNFKKNKEIIYKIYEIFGYEYNEDYTDEFNIYSIIDNDLMSFWNDDIAYNDIITNKNYEKMLRIMAFKIKNKSNALKATHNFHMNNNISSKTKINRYLGGLTIEERKKFISLLKNN